MSNHEEYRQEADKCLRLLRALAAWLQAQGWNGDTPGIYQLGNFSFSTNQPNGTHGKVTYGKDGRIVIIYLAFLPEATCIQGITYRHPEVGKAATWMPHLEGGARPFGYHLNKTGIAPVDLCYSYCNDGIARLDEVSIQGGDKTIKWVAKEGILTAIINKTHGDPGELKLPPTIGEGEELSGLTTPIRLDFPAPAEAREFMEKTGLLDLEPYLRGAGFLAPE